MDDKELEDKKMEEATRWYFSEIMRQLYESERFMNWFNCNFEVHKNIDEEAKTIDIVVLELPPEIVQERMMASIAKEAQSESSIVTTTPSELNRTLKKANNKRKRRRR